MQRENTRERMEQALRASEAKYRRLVALMPAALYACEAPSGRITFYNERAEALWGRAPRPGDDEERFCGSFRLWRPDGSPLAHDQTPMAIALREGRPFRNQDVVVERPDGTRVNVLVNIDPIHDEHGAVVGAINVFQDTTALKQAELEALGHAQRLSAIVDSSDDAIVGKTLDGIILSWNRGAERIFGYAAHEAIGRHITLIVPAERRAEEKDVLARLRRGEKIDHFETERQAKDGRRLAISLTVSPIRDAHGRIVGASKIARDVTEQKRAQAALREADRRKDEFIATLSHELRNPLAPIRTAVELLGAPEAPVREEARAILQRQVRQLTRLVDDLLDLSRVTVGHLALHKQAVKLNEVLEAAIETSRPNIAAAGLRLCTARPPEDLVVNADPLRLGQVITNLLNNAAKYTPSGGTIELSAREESGCAVISVRDDGCGIAPGLLAQIFEPFAKLAVANPSSRSGDGLGIGLSLARKLVADHGGTIEATSEGEGRGAEFTVRVPAARAGEIAPARAPRAARAPGRRRVLVVDDNVDAAQSMGLLLERLGHDVRLAHDGAGALDEAGRHTPEVVLLDLGLPGLDGYGVARQLRGDARLGRVRIVAVTGYGLESDRARTLAAGFDEHLVKPVALEALRGILG